MVCKLKSFLYEGMPDMGMVWSELQSVPHQSQLFMGKIYTFVKIHTIPIYGKSMPWGQQSHNIYIYNNYNNNNNYMCLY